MKAGRAGGIGTGWYNSDMRMRIRVIGGLAVFLSIALTSVADGQRDVDEEILGKLQVYESPYYTIHTDLSPEDAREAAIRMTRMAEEYYERTKEFSGKINQRLPFFLFKELADYYEAGGLPGSAGVFRGKSLMAVAGAKPTAGTWMVVQHEGFHQFAHAVIRGQIPVWANEGLADYFAVSVFTGDGMVSGVIPQWRLKRIQEHIRKGEFKTTEQMMLITLREWNQKISGVNYDQGWSMVHFLAHGENGKYQAAFAAFIREVGKGRPWKDAWADNFGTDIAGFEEKWKAWWLGLKDNSTADLYAKATTATLTSFLARAHAKKQTFDTFEEFLEAAKGGKLMAHEEDWLPPSLLNEALRRGPGKAEWSLDKGPNGSRRIVCKFDEQTTWVGSYILAGTKVAKVRVDRLGAKPQPAREKTAASAPAVKDAATKPQAIATRPTELLKPRVRSKVDPLVSAMSLARAYAGAGDLEKARKTLQKAIEENPSSPAVADAKKLLNEM